MVVLSLVITIMLHLQIELHYRYVYVEINVVYAELSTVCSFKHPEEVLAHVPHG